MLPAEDMGTGLDAEDREFLGLAEDGLPYVGDDAD
jgi:hypothetical protein